MKKGLAAVLLISLLMTVPVPGKASDFPKPDARDKCPVCGMFIAKYPDWTAGIVFKDGTRVFFDGVKDMFKYLFDLKRYNPAKQAGDITSVLVTDYYTLAPVNGREAMYVLGSDVYGPMGRELIPFEKKEAAAEFRQDHAGKSLRSFQEITPALIKALDQ
jgi:nitrous oxide reductase accessory protein NosL